MIKARIRKLEQLNILKNALPRDIKKAKEFVKDYCSGQEIDISNIDLSNWQGIGKALAKGLRANCEARTISKAEYYKRLNK